MTYNIQNGDSAMEMYLLQKFDGNWALLTTISNLNSHSINSSNRNQTKCYSQQKLYHQGIVPSIAFIFHMLSIRLQHVLDINHQKIRPHSHRAFV